MVRVIGATSSFATFKRAFSRSGAEGRTSLRICRSEKVTSRESLSTTVRPSPQTTP